MLETLISPPFALALGIVIALTVGNPLPRQTTSRLTKILLQASVVGLGFGINLQKVLEAGKRGVVFTVITISVTLLIGFIAGRLMRVERTT